MSVSWNLLQNSPPSFASAMWLMQDGTVLANPYGSTQLWRLTPDASGSFLTGTWVLDGNLLLQKAAFASAVLSDGRLVTCGGEFSGPVLTQQNENNFCEIYDPFVHVAAAFAAPDKWTNIGDAPSAVLNDGTFMIGNTQGIGTQVALLNPSTLTWTFGGGDSDNEQGYTLLQTGDVLTTGVYILTSQRYVPGVNAFVPDAPLPVALGAILGGSGETGPGLTLMDGRVVWFGATGHTCIYKTGGQGQNGTWTQVHDMPIVAGDQLFAADVPAILEPNGKVFLLAYGANTAPTFLEYDPAGDSFTIVDNGPAAGNPEYCRMLLLPNGHGLVSLQSGPWYDVTFGAGGAAAWAPTITSFPSTVIPYCTVTLAGTQLCGLSECQSFGDDNQQAENYPVVRFISKDDGVVTYARAHDVSTRSIAPGQSGTVLVDIPGNLIVGAPYAVQVVAMGIPSPGVPVEVLALPNANAERAGDFDGDGVDEILVSNLWGIGLLKKTGDTMTTLMLAPTGTRLGDWLLDTLNDRFGPIADYDNDGRDEILVMSGWGIGVLKFQGGSLTSISMTPAGADLGGTKLNTKVDQFGPILNLEAGLVRLFYTTCSGVALLQFLGGEWSLASVLYNWGSTISGAGVFWTFAVGNRFGPIGDFDGDGINEIIVTNTSGLGVIKLGIEWTPLITASNGTEFTGGWRLDTTSNSFFIAGNYHYDPPAADIILVTSPWGIATLECRLGAPGAALALVAAWIAPNGIVLDGGWTLDTSVDEFGPVWRDDPQSDVQMLVKSPWGIGVLAMSGITTPGPFMSMSAIATAQNGTSLGGWTLDTTQNYFGPAGVFDPGAAPEIFVWSPWGAGILQITGNTFTAAMLQPNGTRLGEWVLNTGLDAF
ncbi:MAG TPA: VCBS repeat-containing protein [Rhizomicrobium sp.]|jgi:hypothetical protein|nr:VCBS repeat-containing protein [Rhizomicrobium sp.]